MAEPFAGLLKQSHPHLRYVVSAAVSKGMPMPALSNALSYFDYARTGRTTANLLQGLRDFFGAHGFERTDKEGNGFHGPWAQGPG